MSLQAGMYDVYAQDWLNVFPREQVYFSKLEDFQQDPDSVKNLFAFIGFGKY